ncbi:hypothetical protein C7Y47_11450 [Lysinibacillus sphaericus]|uniref:Uncharacterized protein n=1 Tax=Lysinibacillus sphaericus TaxID=1421 RepID=A0A544UK59_LYSSH|nr:hypothetical protein [Lysinibacillus sp. SDF0037]TQR33645.1 hypothetical protein C7Y47_11450 [Lysinibacillus sp. SDF0037]
MYNNDHFQLKKQRKNALEILKQWELELNSKNELEKNTNLTKKIKCDKTNYFHIRLNSNKE